MSNITRRQKARKVLHFVGQMTPGGAENWLMKLLRKADRNVLQMDFCVAKPQKGLYEQEIEFLGSKIIHCPPSPILTHQRRLSRILRENHYDVVHAHSWLFSGVILKVAHQCNVPVRIAYCHTTGDEYRFTLYRRLYRWYMRHLIAQHATHRLGCASEAMVALFGNKWQTEDNCRVVYCSIDTESFHPERTASVAKSDFGIPPDSIVIGHVGSFRLAKNHVFLLDIAAEIIKRNKRAIFFLAGDGKLRGEMEEKAHRLGISDRIIFGGIREDVPQLMMNLFDVLLFPSVYEGMPLTLVEAAAVGLRVVCSDVITKEATDVLPEAFTRLSLDLEPEQWAEAVNNAINKGRMPHDYAYKCIKESHFSDEFSLRELMKVYGCV